MRAVTQDEHGEEQTEGEDPGGPSEGDGVAVDGGLRGDFDVTDISLVNAMLGAVVQQTHELSPDLWRRYFAIIVDGLARERADVTDAKVPPLSPSQAELALTLPRHRRTS